MPGGKGARTHPNCVQESGQSVKLVCVSVRSRRSVPVLPLVRRTSALWQWTCCTTKFGGLNKLRGAWPLQLGKKSDQYQAVVTPTPLIVEHGKASAPTKKMMGQTKSSFFMFFDCPKNTTTKHRKIMQNAILFASSTL